jgi:hypothetical protein
MKRPDNSGVSERPTPVNQIIELQRSHCRRIAGHREGIIDDICKACDIGLKLQKSRVLWRIFRKSDWGGVRPPKLGDRKDAVRYALKFMVGPDRSEQQRASFYFNAVGPLIEQGIRGKKLKKILMKRGLKALQQQHSAKSANSKPEAISTVPVSKKSGKNASEFLAWRCRLDLSKEGQELLKCREGQRVRITAMLNSVKGSGQMVVESIKLLDA